MGLLLMKKERAEVFSRTRKKNWLIHRFAPQMRRAAGARERGGSGEGEEGSESGVAVESRAQGGVGGDLRAARAVRRRIEKQVGRCFLRFLTIKVQSAGVSRVPQ